MSTPRLTVEQARNLQVALYTGDTKHLQKILNAGVDVNMKLRSEATFLHRTVENTKLGLTEFLLMHGAEVNARTVDGDTPLMAAARINFEGDIIQLLITNGADINTTNSAGNTALHLAVEFGNHEGIKLLLDAKADATIKNAEGKTAIELANLSGKKNIIALFFEHGGVSKPRL